MLKHWFARQETRQPDDNSQPATATVIGAAGVPFDAPGVSRFVCDPAMQKARSIGDRGGLAAQIRLRRPTDCARLREPPD